MMKRIFRIIEKKLPSLVAIIIATPIIFSCADNIQGHKDNPRRKNNGSSQDLPQPVLAKSLPMPVLGTETLSLSEREVTVDLPSRSDGVFNATCKEDMKRLSRSIANTATIDLSDDAGVSEMDVRDAMARVLYFLISDLGKPLVPANKITVSVYRGTDQHAFVTISRNGKRTIKIDPINFAKLQEMYIAHELVHGFYQPDSWIRRNTVSEAEKWATYEQIRYKMIDNSNREILKYINSNYALPQGMLLSSVRMLPWTAFPANLQQAIYYLSAGEAFSNKHSENVATYFLGMPQKKPISPCQTSKKNAAPLG